MREAGRTDTASRFFAYAHSPPLLSTASWVKMKTDQGCQCDDSLDLGRYQLGSWCGIAPGPVLGTGAAELSGYHPEYIRRLPRQGKIGAEKKGRDWWIDRDALHS